MTKKVVIIGGGLSGIVAAANLKFKNPKLEVVLIEKNNILGGRLYQEYLDKNIINNGPSWLWFKDLINDILDEIGFDYKELETVELNPQYKIIYDKDNFVNVNKNIINDLKFFDKNIQKNLDEFLNKNKDKYDKCKHKYLRMNNLSIREYFSIQCFKDLFCFNIFNNYKNVISKISKNKIVNKILLWPSLFVGSKPEKISGLFTILTYYMLDKGTSVYSKKGMIDLVLVLEKYIQLLDVKIYKNAFVEKFIMKENKINAVRLNNSQIIYCNSIISSIDYRHSESLLDNQYRSYPKLYWDKQVMCPSSLVFNIIIDRKLDELEYHNLFFNYELNQHISNIYDYENIPEKPLFYLNITSKLFPKECCNRNYENLFILIPTSNFKNLNENDIKYLYFNIISQISDYVKFDIEQHIIKIKYTRDITFKNRFNSYRNNAYGLSCENYQFAFFRPKIKSRYVSNLYYCGQTSTPGPGIPPSMISGLNSSNLLLEDYRYNKEKCISYINEFWLIITNIIVNLLTLGFNKIGLLTTFKCFMKEINFVLFNKLKPSDYFKYE